MDPFVEQLASLCRDQVTRAKWVFVPSHALGRTIGERIALGGTNWLNLRFVTPLDIALRMGAPFLVERGIEPSEEGLGPALMMRLLLELPVHGGYFRSLAEQPTMAQALWGTVCELRLAGVKSGRLQPEAFESHAKHAEMCALLAAYEEFLVTSKRGDMATVYEEAVRHPGWCPIQPEDCWTQLPEAIWTQLQSRLIDRLPGERIAPRALEISGATLPRRLAGGKVDRVSADPQSNPLAFLMNGAALAGGRERGAPLCAQATPVTGALCRARSGAVRGQDPPAAAVELFVAGGREAEIEEVFRRILARGASLDQVEIACASDVHVALVWEKALRHEWPMTLGPGIPASSTRPGRALIGFCDWIETDFAAGHLRRLLQSGDMGLDEEKDGFTAGQAARILARAEAGWGRATYDLSLGSLRTSYETRASDPDLSDEERAAARAKVARTETVAAWITKLIASVPEPSSNGTVPLQAVVFAVLGYLEHSTSRSSQLDHRAASALGDYIGELRALGPFACSLPEALRFIRGHVESLQVAAERPRPGHLYACRLAQAGHSGRPHLFVVGLEEDRVFPAATEDAVLLDAERAAISPALRLSSDRIDEAVYGVLSRLATWSATLLGNFQPPTSNFQSLEPAAGRGLEGGNLEVGSWKLEVERVPPSITLSYSCRDTRDFRETYASWLMLQAFRLQQGDATLSYQAMKAALGEPVSSVPANRDEAASASAWWLRTVVGTGDKGIAAVEGTFAAIARGRSAEEARGSDRFTEFDGHVPDAGRVLDPCASGNRFSVTDLEAAAACPFRFFLKRGLGLRPVDEDERDRDVWIDPLTRGSELHDIYAAMLRRCRDAGRRPDLKKDAAWLTKYAQATLDRLNREMPPATAEIFERESRDFLADVELFLEAECEPTTTETIGLEVSFGRPLDDDVEVLARAAPVEIDLGGGLVFRFAGRIDRIDKVGPSSFEIVDYKTGGFYRDGYKGTFNGGRRLQLVLYGIAAEELLRKHYKNPKVTGGQYYHSSHKGRQERVRIPAPKAHEVAAVLGDLRELILSGGFVHATSDRDCTFCDFAPACGNGHQQAEAKIEDPKLMAYGKLAAHV